MYNFHHTYEHQLNTQNRTYLDIKHGHLRFNYSPHICLVQVKNNNIQEGIALVSFIMKDLWILYCKRSEAKVYAGISVQMQMSMYACMPTGVSALQDRRVYIQYYSQN